MFSEGSSQPLTAEDIRFTTKGGVLYAIALGWPVSGTLRIARTGAGLGARARGDRERRGARRRRQLPFKRSRKGLEVRLPEGLAGTPAVVLKVRGTGLA